MAAEPEALRWLLAACRRFLDERGGRGAPPSPLELTVDAVAVDALAGRHQLLGVLHLLVQRRLVAGVPDAQREAWLAAYCVALLRNRRLLLGVGELLDRCAERGLELLVFKGPVHVARFYGDLGVRPMLDVDVLVRPRELDGLIEAAGRADFTRVRQTSPYHLELATADGGCRVEAHFTLYERILEDERRLLEAAWRSAVREEVAGVALPAPAVPVALVLDLAHLLHHDLRVGVRPLLDYAGALQAAGEASAAEHRELLRAVDLEGEHRQLLRLLADELGWWPAGEDDSGARKLRSPLAVQLAAGWASPVQREEGAFRELAYREGLRDKLAFVARTLFPRGASVTHLTEARSGVGRRALHAASTAVRSLRLAASGGTASVPPLSLKRELYRRRLSGRGGGKPES